MSDVPSRSSRADSSHSSSRIADGGGAQRLEGARTKHVVSRGVIRVSRMLPGDAPALQLHASEGRLRVAVYSSLASGEFQRWSRWSHTPLPNLLRIRSIASFMPVEPIVPATTPVTYGFMRDTGSCRELPHMRFMHSWQFRELVT